MGEQIRDRTSSATVVGIILSGLIALMAVGYLYVRITANESYALIHMLMELVGIVVAAGAFMIAWNTRRTMGNSYVLVVALAGAFVAGVDLLHALTYQGMNLIPHVGNNLPTQLWLVGRYLQAASLFIAPLFVIRRAAPAKVMWGFGVATFVLLGSIALGVFPDAYIEPTGLTGFKIASEYVISLAMALGLAGLISMRREQDREVLGFMATAIGCFIAAELVFTLYGRPTAPLNYAGHMLRVAGALFLYRALVVAAITRPFDVLFRDLKQAADGLERSERRFRSTFDQAILGILEIDLGGRIVRANRRMHAFGEYRGSELSGVEASQLTDTKDRASEAELFAALAQGTIQEYRLEKRMITASGSKLWVNAIRSSVLGGDGETRYYIEMAEDISTRREAEGRLERSRGLKSSISKIDSSINSTFDIEEIISTAVAEGAEAIGADSAIVTMHEQHGWELRKAWHFPPHDVAPEVPSGRITELVSLETDGLPLVIEDVDDDPRVNVEVARLFGVRSFIVIPLRFRGRSLGMLFFNYSSGPRDFDEDEIAFAVELSSALTMAIENARLYDAEHRTVDAIQASLLAIEGDIPGVEVGTAYYSAVELARIGGDFFDVFALPDDRVAFAVGDVSGKGIEAAAVTALAKSTVRAFAYEWGSPDRVMRATNQALIRQIGESRFVTLIYGLLDVRTGEVRLVCAGHPAPLICDASGCVEDVSIHNPPLGVFDLMEFEEFRTVLHPGMRLVAFSDGLLDARHGEEFLGEDRVRGLVDAMGDASPNALATELLAAAQHHSHGHPPDDIAILALRYTGL